jgi:hypothetical protein
MVWVNLPHTMSVLSTDVAGSSNVSRIQNILNWKGTGTAADAVRWLCRSRFRDAWGANHVEAYVNDVLHIRRLLVQSRREAVGAE